MIPFLHFAAGHPNFHRFVEVGCLKGHSLSILGKRLIDRGTPFELFAVDLWEQAPAAPGRDLSPRVYEQFVRTMSSIPVHVIRQDSSAAAAQFEDKSLDYVFLDADHTYEKVLQDIDAWRSKVRPGGMLAGHDYGEPCGVKQAVDERFQANVLRTCWYVYM